MRQLYVYILASKSRCLYIGVTNNLPRRVSEHRAGLGNFTSRYRIFRLVYYERLGPPLAAIAREKQLKGWVRRKKVALVEKENPGWRDLADGWGRDPSLHFAQGGPLRSG